MTSTKTITITYGATTVILLYVQATSAYPDQPKNFTEHILEDNSRVRDVSGSPKRRWDLVHDVPMTSQQVTDIETLFSINDTITLTENFVESSATYTVHFESRMRHLEGPNASARYRLIFQEV